LIIEGSAFTKARKFIYKMLTNCISSGVGRETDENH
jgi:hypothetical protein